MNAEIIALQIVKLLATRKGFDGWWDSIDSDTQDEILSSISVIILEPILDYYENKIARLEDSAWTEEGQKALNQAIADALSSTYKE